MQNEKKVDLAEIRKRAGLTQRELAAIVGVGRSYLAMVEAGQKPFSEKLRRKVDAALSTSVSVVGNSAPVAVGSPGACFGGGVSPPGEETLGARVSALEARVSALERALVAALGKGRAD